MDFLQKSSGLNHFFFSKTMLKVIETTVNQLVIKEEKSAYHPKILVVFNCSATYFLLISTLKIWSILGGRILL